MVRPGQWSRYGKDLVAGSASPESHYLIVRGAGHQGLCDVAALLPHRLNQLLRNVLPGTHSTDLPRRTNEPILRWLRNVGVMDGEGGALEACDGTMNHIAPRGLGRLARQAAL